MKKLIGFLIVLMVMAFMPSLSKAETSTALAPSNYTLATKRASNPIPSFVNSIDRKGKKGGRGHGKGKKC